jgi:hypothetical protein
MRGTGVGAYEDNYVGSYTSGTITLIHPLENTYTDSGASQAQVVVVPEASSVTGSLTIPAWDGDVGGLFVVSCSGTFSGTIIGTGCGYRGGTRGTPGTGYYGGYGEGINGAAANPQNSSTFVAHGNAGGGSFPRSDAQDEGQGAGGGGNGTAGQNGNWYLNYQNFGYGGTVVGQADLSTGIFMGGGGGGGGGYDDGLAGTFPDVSGPGRTGGGIIVVYTDTLASAATITNNGIIGGAGNRDQGGGGASAGGTNFIIARNYQSPTISCSGGANGPTSSSRWGGAGGDGRNRILSCSLSGSTTPTASTSIGGHGFCGILGGMV